MTFLRYLGKFMISVGFGILLFVAWTLWGTGIYTENQQRALAAEFDEQLLHPIPADPELGGPPQSFKPGPGDPVFRIRIPRIDVNRIVVQGVDTEELRMGPGHYPDCRPGFPPPLCTPLEEVWPGEAGRVIVSGHRTTYGAPFHNLDKLRPGDDIIIQTRWEPGEFTYEIVDKMIVLPNATDIANPRASELPELVLTTCNPKYSASERLIIVARIQ
jgi:sortase A